MVGETEIRVIAAFVLICGLSVTAAYTIDQYDYEQGGQSVSEAAKTTPAVFKPASKAVEIGKAKTVALDRDDFEELDYHIQYPRFLTALENDATPTTTWRQIWLSDPSVGAPDGLGDYDEDFSKVSQISRDGLKTPL
ncbi:MAG: hypothetical protein ACR2OX_05405 [Methyloligellaceae bacterium]